ncbi:TenA family transcriptional regulator [Ideonella sp.]|uniref:TenA family transcriptional regulator n=1 Tax=Ideonella sp. TaxID=1929293 RepID=UPI002C14FF01|nr:iron-containing redox enzyme family protein [Ramlibacter sp.]
MNNEFALQGALTDIRSYPDWVQDLVAECEPTRLGVTRHELFRLMRDACLAPGQTRNFLAGIWPVIEQFPQYMALNLLKVALGRVRGHDQARRYLIRNIRVEQNHADHWQAWALAAGLSLDDLIHGAVPPATEALSHWCWHSCERDSLAAGMAATNYAIEGATGEWATLVCTSDAYEQSLPELHRTKAMKWLKLHAKYDDTHPWEALEIISTLVGTAPNRGYVDLIRSRVLTSYNYMQMALDKCLEAPSPVLVPRRDPSRYEAARERV